ncbi:MAG TPA: 6-phosphogluconolactonase [Thermoleophilaceae bacterium]|nr:6-phosphogluconolactonase [Thermoleophilaceae bacterium]
MDIAVVEDVAGAAAERIAETVRAGGHIALSGGSTPRAAHERVAEVDLDWGRATLWFGDDRAVPPDHEHSNFAMAEASLLDRLKGEGPDVHRIQGELGHEEAAAAYERELREAFGQGPPRIDLLMLGLGPDAHCASLFPGDAALAERERWVTGVETPGMPPLVSRVTVTLPVLNAARAVLFLISGDDKAAAVARAFGDAPGPDAPASLVRPDPGRLTVLLDPPAAAWLKERR